MSVNETIDCFEDFFQLILESEASSISIKKNDTPSVKVAISGAVMGWNNQILDVMGVDALNYGCRIDDLKSAYTEYRLDHAELKSIEVIRHSSGNVYAVDDKGRGVNFRMFTQLLGMLGIQKLNLNRMDDIMNCDYLLLKNVMDAKEKLNWIGNRILEGMR